MLTQRWVDGRKALDLRAIRVGGRDPASPLLPRCSLGRPARPSVEPQNGLPHLVPNCEVGVAFQDKL